MGRVTAKSGSAQPATSPPETVKFMHLNIRIEPGVTDQDSMGEWYARTGSIGYDPSQNLPVLRETILHEMLHCIFEHTGVDPDEHETLIRSISPLLLHTIRENPNLIRWLVA
jgi:hypothetical protein